MYASVSVPERYTPRADLVRDSLPLHVPAPFAFLPSPSFHCCRSSTCNCKLFPPYQDGFSLHVSKKKKKTHETGNLLSNPAPDIVSNSSGLFQRRVKMAAEPRCRSSRAKPRIDPPGSEGSGTSPLHLSVILSAVNDLAVRSGKRWEA